MKTYNKWSECTSFSDQWDEIVLSHAQLPAGLGPFCSFALSRFILETLSPDATLKLYTTKDAIHNNAFAPCYVRRSQSLFMPLRELRLIQNLYPGRAGFIFDNEGVNGATNLLNNLFSTQASDWDIFNITLVEGSLSERVLLDCLSHCKLPFSTQTTEDIPYIEFPESWDSMNANLPKKYRHTIKKSKKDLQALGELALREYILPNNADEFIAAYEAIERASWKEDAGTSLSMNSEQQLFHSELAKSEQSLGNRIGYTLNLDGKPIAYIFGILINDVYCDLKESFDASFSKYSPGAVLKSLVFMDILPKAVKYWDFIGKAEFHKLRWTSCLYTQKNYIIFSKSLSGRMHHYKYILNRLVRKQS